MIRVLGMLMVLGRTQENLPPAEARAVLKVRALLDQRPGRPRAGQLKSL